VRRALGAILFFLVAPGMVAGYVPYRLTRWQTASSLSLPFRIAGIALAVVGLVSLVECFARFVLQGRGTPAPVAPPTILVVSGPYRYVRNPMYVAVVAIILGQAALLGSTRLVAYAAVIWVVFHCWVIGYEEPRLADQFGDSYRAYRAAVGRWLPRPRRKPLDGPASQHG
jgi:protein-S-isoprenylcysteine O-methyltransferase Ste14